MFNSPFPRKLILLKKLLYHIGKHKLDIHGRILSIIAVFFLQTLIMPVSYTHLRRMMDEINRLIDEVYVNKIALKEFELKALQAQINPHFLYNTLSAINWMAIRSNQKEISKVTLALSTFYRTALSRGEDMVTMESCITNTEAYLEIQLVMHNHEFFVQWEMWIRDRVGSERRTERSCSSTEHI